MGASFEKLSIRPEVLPLLVKQISWLSDHVIGPKGSKNKLMYSFSRLLKCTFIVDKILNPNYRNFHVAFCNLLLQTDKEIYTYVSLAALRNNRKWKCPPCRKIGQIVGGFLIFNHFDRLF